MKRFDETRQKSIDAWGPEQKRWRQDQFKHPNFVVAEARDNANQNDEAAAAAGSSSGGGGYVNLPLESLQTTSFVYTREDGGNFYYVTMNHTTGETYPDVDTGINSDVYYVDSQLADSFGYAVFTYSDGGNERIIDYISPSGQIITHTTYQTSGFNQQEIFQYYGGGISVLLINTSNKTASLVYYYNGEAYSKVWTSNTWFGIYNDFSLTGTKQGTVLFATYNNIGQSVVDLWVLGPGVGGPGFLLKDQYTMGSFLWDSDTDYTRSGLPVGQDGRLLNNAGYYTSQNWLFAKENLSGYLTEIEIVGAEYPYTYSNGWQCLQDIKDALIANFSTTVDTDSLILDGFQVVKSGKAIGFGITDDNNIVSYLCLVDIDLQTVSVFLGNDIYTLGNWTYITNASNSVIAYVAYNETIFDARGTYSDAGFLISLIDYAGGGAVLTQFEIPSQYDGDDLYIDLDNGAIAHDANSVTLLAFVDNLAGDAYTITVARNSAPIYNKIIGLNSIGVTNCYSYQCWNDIKNEWFASIVMHKSDTIQHLLVKTSNRQILNNRIISTVGFDDTSYGMAYVPVMLKLYNSGVYNIWCLDYNNYTWNLAIDTTATPTTDSNMYTYYEYYDSGFQNYPGGSRWIFADPDLSRCWYITSKYGVQQSETVSFAVASSQGGAPFGGSVGQVYSYGGFGDNPGDFGLCATEVSTGLTVPLSIVDLNNCIYFEFLNDKWLFLYEDVNGNPQIDVFIGGRRSSFAWYNIWWATNDIYWTND